VFEDVESSLYFAHQLRLFSAGDEDDDVIFGQEGADYIEGGDGQVRIAVV